MNYLLDSNIFLEAILQQENTAEVQELLTDHGDSSLYVSDFTLHSIGHILFRRRHHQAFEDFITDVIGRLNVGILSLDADGLKNVIEVATKYTLDFDDAYQYTIAEQNDLAIVSYDTDFNRTPRRSVTPGMVLRSSTQQNQADSG